MEEISNTLFSELNNAVQIIEGAKNFKHIIIPDYDCSQLPGIETNGKNLPDDLTLSFFSHLHKYDQIEGNINDFPCIYAFELVEESDTHRVLEEFTKIDGNKIQRKLPTLKSQPFQNSKYLYIGKCDNSIESSLVAHFGYSDETTDFGLQLAYWLKDVTPAIKLNVHIFRFIKEFEPYLKHFEVKLSELLNPIAECSDKIKTDNIQIFTAGIENKILETINVANRNLIIMSAWFTNRRIIDALLLKKKSLPNMTIEILVTNDHVNRTYFLEHKDAFDTAGIKTKLYSKSQLMHNKIILIDDLIYVTGSYNLSVNANKNIENIIIVESAKLCKYTKRIFSFLSDPDYIDPNIKLLAKYPDFCRELLSTYYPFTKTDLRKYHNKIELGDCFSYDVGDYNKIGYSPGLIFNQSITLVKFNDSDFFGADYYHCEYPLPVSKEQVQMAIEGEAHCHIISSFNGHPEWYHIINDILEETTLNIKESFRREIENCFSPEEMEQKIIEEIDIIKEDDLWKVQFQPFLTKATVHDLLKQLPRIEKSTLLSKNILRKNPIPDPPTF